ncbi:MAG: SDR family oxidoreductase [Nannocystaceae bacterium]
MRSGLEELTVVITGASGGIGWATAEAFADEGAHLVLHAHTGRAALEGRVAAATWADRALVFAGDLRDEDANEALFAAACERFGRVDVAILNAGIWPPAPLPLWETPATRLREVLDTNLLGVIFGARAFLRRLADRGPREDRRGASLCLIGSTAGRFGEADHVAYAVTKAGLRGLMRSLKNEIVRLDPYGRVNLVEPGWTVTPMARAALDDPAVIPKVLATMPVRQLARPEDIARALLFFSAPALARHVSGEILTVAGGMEGRRLWDAAAIDVAEVRRRLDSDE